MARTKIMNIWFWTLNSEWTYIINDNSLAGGASVPLPLVYLDTTVSGEITIFDDSIYQDFPDVALITVNPIYSPNGETIYMNSDTSFMLSDYVTCFDLSSLGSFSGGGSVDLTPVMFSLSQIQAKVDIIPDYEAVSAIVSSSLSALDSVELNNLHEDIVTLGTQLSTVTVPLQSLNGNGSEYKDGVQVSVTGRLPVYTVSRSYMSMMDTDTYTCVYDLEAPDGSKTTCPESFLTLYVAPVVTP